MVTVGWTKASAIQLISNWAARRVTWNFAKSSLGYTEGSRSERCISYETPRCCLYVCHGHTGPPSKHWGVISEELAPSYQDRSMPVGSRIYRGGHCILPWNFSLFKWVSSLPAPIPVEASIYIQCSRKNSPELGWSCCFLNLDYPVYTSVRIIVREDNECSYR